MAQGCKQNGVRLRTALRAAVQDLRFGGGAELTLGFAVRSPDYTRLSHRWLIAWFAQNIASAQCMTA